MREVATRDLQEKRFSKRPLVFGHLPSSRVRAPKSATNFSRILQRTQPTVNGRKHIRAFHSHGNEVARVLRVSIICNIGEPTAHPPSAGNHFQSAELKSSRDFLTLLVVKVLFWKNTEICKPKLLRPSMFPRHSSSCAKEKLKSSCRQEH